jgi:hypothetical protein
MGKSGMNNPDHISESLENFFWAKVRYLNSLIRIRDGKIWIRDGKNSDPGWKKFGSGINIPDPKHC